MKKILLSLIALVASVGMYAQDPKVVLDFTDGVNAWGLPNGSDNAFSGEATFSNGTYTITVNAASKGYYLASNKTLLFGKKNSYVTLPKFNFNVGKIVLKAKGGSASTLMNVFVGDNAVSGEVKGINVDATFGIDAAYQAAGNAYTIKVLSDHNCQFQAVEIYEATGEVVKKAANLKWDKQTTTYIIGKEFTSPKFTCSTTATVTFSSDNTSVATVDNSGVVSVTGKEGTAVISATSPENSEYEAGEGKLTVIVKSETSNDYNTPATALTAPQANAFVVKGENLDKYVYVKGVITSIKSLNVEKYTNAQFYIAETAEASETFYVYNIKYLGGEDFTSNDQIKVGDEVVIYAKLTKYTPKEGNPIYETAAGGRIYSINGITGISNVTVSADNTAVYNLAGQRIDANNKGIVIKGGKKYINK